MTQGTGTAEGKGRRYFVVRGERFDWPGEFTGRELQFIKLETGLRSGELDEALEAGDVEAMLALVVVAMRRAGREDAQLEDLLDLSIGSEGPDGLDFLIEDDEGGDRPTGEDGEDAADETATDPIPKARKGTAARTGRRRSSGSTGSGRGN